MAGTVVLESGGYRRARKRGAMLDLTVPGDSFTKSTRKGEESFLATVVEGPAKVTISLDCKRELARVVLRNVELGRLRAGQATDFVLDPGNGAGVFTNHVRRGGSGRKVFY